MDRDHLSPAPRMPLLTRLKLNRNSQVRSSYRTEATLARSRGAKWGANDRRHWAVPGHNQPPYAQLNATSGHIWHPSGGGPDVPSKRWISLAGMPVPGGKIGQVLPADAD